MRKRVARKRSAPPVVIGPSYEDKVARRGLRVGDLFDKETFAEKLKEVMEYHNFQLVNYYKAEAVDCRKFWMIRWLLPTS